MDARHEAYIVEHWPEWFDTKGDIRHTLMPFGFQHGNGWFGLVCGLCDQLEPLVRDLNETLRPHGGFEVLEVKQKTGELRFYVSHHNDAIDAVIEAARLRSLEMCEVCSRLIRTVELRDHSGWLVTLCEDCEGEYQQKTRKTQEARMKAASKFPAVYLLHGKGGSPRGSVLQLETLLRRSFPDLQYVRPSLPHGGDGGGQSALRSIEFLRELRLETGALVVGISRGGLVAALLQEIGREDLHVICISAPTSAEGLELELLVPRRVAFYSSCDEVIAGRTSLWPYLAEAYDLPWLAHDTDAHKDKLARLIVCYMRGGNIGAEVEQIGHSAVG